MRKSSATRNWFYGGRRDLCFSEAIFNIWARIWDNISKDISFHRMGFLLSDPSGTDLYMAFSAHNLRNPAHNLRNPAHNLRNFPSPVSDFTSFKLIHHFHPRILSQLMSNFCVHRKCWTPMPTANVDYVYVCRTHRVPTYIWLFSRITSVIPRITSVIFLLR